ncbi:UNVERIFIED_CONTAM: hypothetical protein GTU68_045287 [Idotea baltica]|nr:hypothetical protein [Idotea baltica]
MGFTSLGLSAPILKAVEAQGYSTPSPIQLQAIPAVIEGKDVMAAAQTGTGKTAGFTLPLLERLSKGPKLKFNQVRALVLTPTRELAAQVHESVEKYSINLPLTSDVVFGGVKANPQMQRLRKGVDVLVATPGRLLDLALEEKGISSAAIHGNKSQGARTKALANFKSGQVRVLVATDIAARGLDIEQLPQVINVDLPKVPEDYVHRIGRTGRAGATGKAISFVSEDEAGELFAIERLIQKILPRHVLEGFEPEMKVPESRLDSRPIKAKKPKKTQAPRQDHRDGQRSGENRSGHRQGAKPAPRRNTENKEGGAAKKEGGNAKKRPTDGGKPRSKGNGENRGNGSNFGGGKPNGAAKPKTDGTKPRRQGPRPARKPQPQQ